MCLFKSMVPDDYLDSAYDIDYKKFYEDGFRGVIFDIDNTLVPQDAPSDDRSRKLLEELNEIGFKVLLLSNNKEPRVKMFLESMDGGDGTEPVDGGGKTEDTAGGECFENGAEHVNDGGGGSYAVKPDYICNAAKPSRKGYFQAMERMGTTTGNTLFVGDQLFTDVWGARRSGIYSILVKPMNPKEDIQIVFKRKLEKPILATYKKKINKRKIKDK